MFVYKKFKASDAGILAFEAHKEYNVSSTNTASLDISFVNTQYSSASLDTYSTKLGDILNAKRYRQLEFLLYKGGVQNYANLLGGLEYIDQEKRLYGRANVLEISQKNTGNGIQKGTFNLNGAYKDDSKGNIFDSTTITLIDGHAQNYPKEKEKCFYLGPTYGYKYTDLNHEIRTGKLIVNAPRTLNDNFTDDSIYLNSIEYIDCSIKHMEGGLSEYTGINLDEGYVKVAHSNNFNFSDEDFTISFWYKPNDTTGTKYIISKGFTKTVAGTPINPNLKESGSLTGRQEVDAGNSYPFAIYSEGSNLYFERSDENSTCRVKAPIYGTQLLNFIFVKEGNTLRSYTNGIAETTATDTTTNCGNEADLFIGNKGGSRSVDSYEVNPAGGEISQIIILNKAVTGSEVHNLSSSINGSPFVGNIFYENGLATITKPNIAANTLVSAETVTETLTLGTIPNNVDPDYIFAIVANDVFTGELTFFTSSIIFDITNPNKAQFDAIPGLILTDPTFTADPESGGDFILSTSGSSLTTTVFINPIFNEFDFVLLDAAVEVSNSFEGVAHDDYNHVAVGETLDIGGSLLSAIGEPSSEGEYGFYHPPQVIESASFVVRGVGLSTSRGYKSSDDDASKTHLSSWFDSVLEDENVGTGNFNSMLRRVARVGSNQTDNRPILNSPSDLEGIFKFEANKNTVISGVQIDFDTNKNITNATTFRNFRKNSSHFFSVTGSRGNIASIKQSQIVLTSSQNTNTPYVTASNTSYNTNYYFPGGFENGGINPTLTSSQYTHQNSHPNIYSGIKTADSGGFQFRSAQLLGGQHQKAVYGGLDNFALSATFNLSPSSSNAGGQLIQFKVVYYHNDDGTYWNVFDESNNICESLEYALGAIPDGGSTSFSQEFTINPSTVVLEDINDSNVNPDWNVFEDENDKLLVLFKTRFNPSSDPVFTGAEDGVIINGNSNIQITRQTPDFGPRDVLYLESDYIYPISGNQEFSHFFSINGITTDSASLIEDANPNPHVDYPNPDVYHDSRGILDNISSSFYLSGSDLFGNGFISYDFATVPLALRVELVEFDIDQSNPSAVVPDFFQGGRILTSSLFPAGTNVGGNFSIVSPTVSGDAGASGIARDLDFQFEITKSTDETAIAWRIGVVSADNPGDLTSVDDFPLIPVNTAEGFGFSGVHIATFRPTATYSLAPSTNNPNPLTNDHLRAVLTSTHSLNGGNIVGNVHKKGDLNIAGSSLLMDGTLPTLISDLDLSNGLNPNLVDIHFNQEFLVTESYWVVTASYQPALPVKVSASFVTDEKGLYEIHQLRSLYFHNPQDPLNNDIPIYSDWVNNPENAPQLQYKVFIEGVEQTDFSQTSSFAPNRLQTIYDENAEIIGHLGHAAANTSMSIEVTLVTGSNGDDALVYPHQGIAIKDVEIVALTSSFQVTKLNGSSFTLEEAQAVSCSVNSPHTNAGDADIPFDVGAQSAIHIVSFSGGSQNRQIMHLGLDYFTTESSNMLCELRFDNPFTPIEAKLPFSYEPNRVYSFDFQSGISQALTSITDDPIPSDVGFGFKIIDAGGSVIPGSPQKFIQNAGSISIFDNINDDFDATFNEAGTGHIVLFSSGTHAGDYLDGNVSASYTIEIDRLSIEISELQGSNTSTENVTFTGTITPDNLQVTSSHVNQGSHGFFTTGSAIYDVVGQAGGNGNPITINQTLFITASSPATASVDEASGFDYTQTPVVVNSGDLSDDMVGGTFTFTDITGNTIIYIITAVNTVNGTITLDSQTIPAEGFDNQILVAPSDTNITLTYNQPADNENFSLVFKNNQLIFENEFHCTVDEDEYNFTLNPTARKYKTIQRGELANFATGSNFRPYVTTVGLYNDEGELLVVGKLAQPVKTSTETDTTFVVRYDT